MTKALRVLVILAVIVAGRATPALTDDGAGVAERVAVEVGSNLRGPSEPSDPESVQEEAPLGDSDQSQREEMIAELTRALDEVQR